MWFGSRVSLCEPINQLHALRIAQVKISDFGISKLTTSSQDLLVGDIDVLLNYPRSCCGYKGVACTSIKTWGYSNVVQPFIALMVLERERERERGEKLNVFFKFTLNTIPQMNKWTGMIPESHVNVWFAAAPEGLSNLSWIARLPRSRGGSLRHQSQTKKRPRWLRKLGQMENCFWSYTIAVVLVLLLVFWFRQNVLNIFWSMANYSVAGPLPPHPMVWVVVVGFLVVVVAVVIALVKSCSHSRSGSSSRIIYIYVYTYLYSHTVYVCASEVGIREV